MKASETFKRIINDHLDGLAEKDALFAETLKKPNKSLDECVNYILSEVQKSGCNGFADEEVFCMAVHYYDEDDIKVGNVPSGRVIVNHKSTPKPAAPARAKAPEEQPAAVKPQKPAKKSTINTISLFD